MNKDIFIERLVNARKDKGYKSQRQFADAYQEKFGMIRGSRSSKDGDMFGTIQSWEQGRSCPPAPVLANICELLDVDADYLLGRIEVRKHDIESLVKMTGLSEDLAEMLLIPSFDPDLFDHELIVSFFNSLAWSADFEYLIWAYDELMDRERTFASYKGVIENYDQYYQEAVKEWRNGEKKAKRMQEEDLKHYKKGDTLVFRMRELPPMLFFKDNEQLNKDLESSSVYLNESINEMVDIFHRILNERKREIEKGHDIEGM